MPHARTLAIVLTTVLSAIAIPHSPAQDLKSLDGHWACSTSHGGYYFKYTLDIRRTGPGKWRGQYTAGESNYPFSKPGSTAEYMIEADGPNRFKFSVSGLDDPHPDRRGPWEEHVTGTLDDSGLHWNVHWKTAQGDTPTWSEECVRIQKKAIDGLGPVGARRTPRADETATSLRIDRADIATKAIVARAVAKVKPEVVTLASRKETLEEAIPELEKRAQQVLVPNDGALVAQLTQRLDDAQYALRKLEAAMPSELRDRVANRRNVGAQLDAVNARLAAARRDAPGDVQRLLNQSAALRRAVKELDDQIEAALRTSQLDDLWRKWSATARLVADTLSNLRDTRARREVELAAAEGALRDALVQRDQADQRLLEIAELLSLNLRSITIEADRTPVFEAVTTVSLTELEDLNRRIADASQGLPLLDAERAQARLDFVEASKAATEALTKVESTIMKVAIGKAVVDGGFFLADVAKAGVKGGLFGVVAELAKKEFEILVLDNAWPKESGVDPGSIEGEVNRAYNAGLKEASSTPEVKRTLEERVLKETVLKAGKDKLNQVLERSVFDKTAYAWKYRYVVQRPRPPRPADLATYFSVRDKLKKAREIMKGPAFKPSVSNVVESLVKDLAKTGLKAALDAVEHDAWVQYFEKEVIARTYYPLLAAASSAYWTVYDEKESLEYKKAELLAGAGGEAVKTTLSRTFKKGAKLTVRLEFAGKNSPDIDTLVGGAKALLVGSLTYQLDSNSLAARSGIVQLELR